ncbi:MAG: N-acyl-D-amino-acid deacylase family protein [Sphingomonadaceae bacterium]
MLDLLIRGGWVADGTGNPAYPADIAIEGDRIVDVGRLPEAQADCTIDASGKIVCPGFIDAHSHTDSTILGNPTAESTIRQGITTEIVGNCGMSIAPVTEEALSGGMGGFGSFAGIHPRVGGFGQILEYVAHLGTSQNLAWLLGHNTIRHVAGVSGSRVTQDQYRTMEGCIREAMEAGVLGFSTGLEFEPGRSATPEEITRLVGVVGQYGGIYASHIRNRDAHVQEAVEEFLDVVRASGTRGEVSHLNIRHNTGAPEGAWQRAVDTIERARREGMQVLTDMTPLTFGIGSMASILPPWVRAEGHERAVELLRDPTARAKLRTDCDRYWRFIHRGEWHRVRMQANPAFPEINGMSFPEISEAWGKDPWDCYFDILAAAGPRMDGIVLVAELFTEDHLREAIGHPLFMLVVDGYSTTAEGPLAEQTRFPLHYMGMVHFLTHHVREKRTLRLEEAIRKMTSMPATHFGLRDRGLLRPGYFADVVVLDFEKLEDVSTVEQPLAYARGVEHVLVNGVPVISDGEHTGARPGRNLRRD